RVAVLARLSLAELLEEIVEGIVLRQIWQSRNLQIILSDLGVALHVDADHGRAHLLHEVGEAQGHSPKGCLNDRCALGSLCRLCGCKAHVLAKREPQGAYGNYRGRRHREPLTRKLPRALLGHGAPIRLSHQSHLSPAMEGICKNLSLVVEERGFWTENIGARHLRGRF